MEWLKKLLEAAKINDGVLDIDGLMAQISAEFPKQAVPKETFNAVSNDLKQAKKDIATRDTQLQELKDSAGDIETLKTTIETMAQENTKAEAKYQEEIKQIKLNNAIEKALSGAKAKNLRAVKALLDMEKVELDGDNLKGLDDQITALTTGEDSKFLFDAAEDPKPNFRGINPAEGGDGTPKNLGNPANPSYEELCAILPKE
ncbi:phage scaffolding protein [Acetobacterium wieringae]|uniref:phage scaffolding protein n=1 Tax=Acetobacterium wieringae TaxID=52694 RepID=UPI002033D76B|nr:phage scaffolding protein [Acetobacterium wieringae]URN83979.1 phage scaffolding protein [Acetobacterium wieringae]